MVDIGNLINVLMMQHKEQIDEQVRQSRGHARQHKEQIEEQA